MGATTEVQHGAPPRHSPWGEVQYTTDVAPGIWHIGTAGHGGYHLSPSRNAEVPAAIRREDRWYEEDCNWAAVAVAFPAYFKPDIVEHAKETMRNWHPTAWERLTGQTLTAEQSYMRREYPEGCPRPEGLGVTR